MANEQSTINQVLINDTTEYTVKTVMWNEQVSVVSQEMNTGDAHAYNPFSFIAIKVKWEANSQDSFFRKFKRRSQNHTLVTDNGYLWEWGWGPGQL